MPWASRCPRAVLPGAAAEAGVLRVDRPIDGGRSSKSIIVGMLALPPATRAKMFPVRISPVEGLAAGTAGDRFIAVVDGLGSIWNADGRRDPGELALPCESDLGGFALANALVVECSAPGGVAVLYGFAR